VFLPGATNLGLSDNQIVAWGSPVTTYIQGQSAGNVLDFVTASAYRMRIQPDGRVSIGTTTAGQRLTVQQDIASSMWIQARNDTAGGSAGFLITTNGGANQTSFYQAGDGSAVLFNLHSTARLALGANNTEALTILPVAGTQGFVGVGTTAPAYELTVSGTGQATYNITNAGAKGGTLYLRDTSNNVDSGGAILFGTGFGTNTFFAGIRGLVNDGSNNTTGFLSFSIRANSAATQLTEVARFNSVGNFNIGLPNTASPPWSGGIRSLDILGASMWSSGIDNNFSANLYFNGTNWIYRGAGPASLFSATSGGFIWYTAVSGAVAAVVPLNQKMILDVNGNLGIGQNTPQARLDLGTDGNGTVLGVSNMGGYSDSGAYSIWGGRSTLNGSLIQLFGSSNVSAPGDLAYTSATPTGAHVWSTAPAGQVMRVTPAGALLTGGLTTALFNGGKGAVSILSQTQGPLSLRSNDAPAGQFWTTGPNSGNAYLLYNQSGIGQYMQNGTTSWTTNPSDERSKTDYEPFVDAVAKLITLRAGTARLLTDEPGTKRSFLFAQDVLPILPSAVSIAPKLDLDSEDRYGLAYGDLIPMLVAAVKELNARLVALGG
jgi:hypothetical protein